MIVASLGLHLAIFGQDHETARAEGASLSSWHCALGDRGARTHARCRPTRPSDRARPSCVVDLCLAVDQGHGNAP
jgi:hypothetical protein